MPGVVRLGDKCTGHGGFPPRPSITGSANVFINNKPAVTVGDSWAVHCSASCHSGVTAAGSSTVFVNGKPLMRIGDAVNCGSMAAEGSTDVISG